MREIKFRVWNTLLKEYVPEDIVYLSPDGSLLFGSIMMNDAIYIKRNFQKYKDVILEGENIVEQYTGLKDKNGKAIYENDIIFQKPLGKNSIGWAGKIIFKQGAFMAEVHERGKIVMYLFLSDFNPEKTCEVIGNIHETNVNDLQ